MADEILADLWRAKDELARACGYDVFALAAEMQRRERESGQPTVDLSRPAVLPVPTTARGRPN